MLTECSETAPDADVDKSVHGALQVVMPFACVWHVCRRNSSCADRGEGRLRELIGFFAHRPCFFAHRSKELSLLLFIRQCEGAKSRRGTTRRGPRRERHQHQTRKQHSPSLHRKWSSSLSIPVPVPVCSAAALSRKLTRGCCNQSLEREKLKLLSAPNE